MAIALDTAPHKEPQSLVEQAYLRLFGHHTCHFDLVEGVVFSPAQVRIIYLSEDIIRGIYDALVFEAGEAWTVIMTTCGQLWGQRVTSSLKRELMTLDRPLDSLTVDHYIALLEGYFSHHGWGRLTFDLARAETLGVVQAKLQQSLFRQSLDHVEGPVDYMVAGMLQGLFGAISQQTLQAVEFLDARTHTSEFLISAPERMEPLVEFAQDGGDVHEALQRLGQT